MCGFAKDKLTVVSRVNFLLLNKLEILGWHLKKLKEEKARSRNYFPVFLVACFCDLLCIVSEMEVRYIDLALVCYYKCLF